MLYITDLDSRAEGGAHPLSHLWDNGADPINELQRLLDVRQAALTRFGAGNLRVGEPYGELEDVLVPLYLLHRYQVEAVHRLLGGTFYEYSVYEGEPASVDQVIPVSAADQLRALDALLQTLNPAVLTLSQEILALIPPRAPGYGRNPESFPLRTALGLDFVTIAETAADHTISGVLQAERLTRINNLNMLDGELPAVNDVLLRVVEGTFYSNWQTGAQGAVQRAVNNVVLYRMLDLLKSDRVDNQVKAAVNLQLRRLEDWLDERLEEWPDAEAADSSGSSNWQAHYQLAMDEIENWLDRGAADSLLSAPLPMPPGAPI